MKLIATVLFPLVYSQGQENDFAGAASIILKTNEEIQKIEQNDALPHFEPFKTLDGMTPTHDPADFEGEDIINLSENLSNARNVKMLDVESGEELSGNTCGFWGCQGDSSIWFHADHAIDGEPQRQPSLNYPLIEHGFSFFFSNRFLYTKSAFVADIENEPTVGFVKLWPSKNANYDFTYHTTYYSTRIFVNDIECLPIEHYSPERVQEMLNMGNGFDYPGMIFKCAENVEKAYTIRAHNAERWLTFKEIEIFAPIEQTTVREFFKKI